jgi:DNA-binding transcriptional LysR family regulator
MEFRHLRYFVAVVEERQFVRAAARLHVAQSALSHQIADLERELGTALLVRDRRGVSTTPAGDVLLRHARTLLDQAEDARAEIASLTGVVTGVLRVGTGSPSGPVALPAALAELKRRHPQVEIALQDTTSEELLRWLDEGVVDVALVTVMPAQLPGRFEGDLIAEESVLALVPEAHPLASRARLSLGDFADQPLVTFPRGSGMRDVLEQGFADAQVPWPKISAETLDPLSILELVSHELGVALVPESFAALADASVRPVVLTEPGLSRPLMLTWARARRGSPALAAFLEIVPDTLHLAAELFAG